MARIRTIKPQHWADKELSNISLQAHLLWIALWNFSDDEGIFENDAILIKSQVFPRRTDVRVEQVSQWLDQLVKARFVIPFEYNGSGYYIHRTFKAHQKIDKPQKSKIPSEIILRIFDEQSDNVRPCKVEESKVEEGSVGASPPDFENNEFKILPKNQKKEKKIAPGPEISVVYPFADQFKIEWDLWKQYKANQCDFRYKGPHSEQAAINHLMELSGGLESTAIKIIHQSIANGWKGLFHLKTQTNGNSEGKQPTGAGISVSSLYQKIAGIADTPGKPQPG